MPVFVCLQWWLMLHWDLPNYNTSCPKNNSGKVHEDHQLVKLFPQGRKCTPRHSDWRHPSRNASRMWLLLLLSWMSHYLLMVHFVLFFFYSFKSADQLAFETTWDGRTSPLGAGYGPSLPVNSTLGASLAELSQEVSATRMLVSWATQEGCLWIVAQVLAISIIQILKAGLEESL